MVKNNNLYLYVIAFEEGQWLVLEPIMSVEVIAPTEFQGIILSQISKRSGVVTGTDAVDNWFTLFSEVHF